MSTCKKTPEAPHENAVREAARRALLPPWLAAVLAMAYVAAVLMIDTLAVHRVDLGIQWRAFLWHTAGGFDLFKLIGWLVVPFLLCLYGFDWGALGVARWKRVDWILLAALAGVELLAVLAIPLIPALQNVYQGMGDAPADVKWHFATGNLAFLCSWLLGWEFMHRYFLLRHVEKWLPRWGWLMVPLCEGLYHLQKPLLEAGGMVLFSVVVTLWVRRRKNILLPLLAHLT
ncbi:MAG TPA: hypothetical protein ENN80_04250, partial [Candidatus Hydrogenedentes bacterium]|nr:hypothetical protein [Candidatus Hydrogenedentota bacterium]